MKNTALTQKHIALGAKMVPFAGYNMPVQYEGVNAEHEIVRNGVGVFDVSHMGEFFLKGENALAGNWRMSGRKNGDQFTENPLRARRTYKLLTGTRFQWMAINIETGEFSGTGGGTYHFTSCIVLLIIAPI